MSLVAKHLRRPLLASAIAAALVLVVVEASWRVDNVAHSPTELLTKYVGVVATILYFWVLVSAIRRPSREWKLTRMPKLLWILGLVLFPWIGLAVYVFIAAPRLIPAGERGQRA